MVSSASTRSVRDSVKSSICNTITEPIRTANNKQQTMAKAQEDTYKARLFIENVLALRNQIDSMCQLDNLVLLLLVHCLYLFSSSERE
jgi:hypothetical protein